MTRPALIAEMSVAVPASTCARLRHGLVRMLKDAQRARERIPDDVIEAVLQIDQLGAAWDRSHRSDLSSSVSSNVSSLPDQSFDRVDWESVNTKTAADRLGITPQAVTGLLDRGSLHGEKTGRVWRVCAESVTARKEGSTCQH